MVILSVFWIRSFVVKADAYSLYATSCLGGWENTSFASGAPDVKPFGEMEEFSAENSAVLDSNSQSQIFCGGFTGEILAETIPKKIEVKLSLSLAYPEVEVQLDESSPEDASNPTSTSEEIIETEGEVQGEITAEEPIIEEPTIEEPVVTPTEPSLLEPEPESTPTEPEPVVEEESAPSEEPEVLLLNFLTPVARAQDTSLDNVVSTSTATTTEDTVVIIQEEASPYGVVEILYTLDGATWESLGFVDQYNLDSAHFEIPIESASQWEDISKIQVSIQSTPAVDGVQPTIYLDSVWLETEYEYIGEYIPEEPIEMVISELVELIVPEEEVQEEIQEEEPIERTAEETPRPPLPYSVRKLDREIVIDPSAPHKCEIRPFTVDISGLASTNTQIFLEKEPSDGYELEVGSLPADIIVKFLTNNRYVYQPEKRETETTLSITNGRYSRKGNFSVSIYFTKEGGSSTLCQFNILNE